MKKKLLFLMLMMAFTFTACNSGGGSSSGKSSSTEFTSEQDVINYCYGKTFRPDYFDISTTVSGNNDISVLSFTNTTAIVKVYFDMGAVTGRAYKSGLKFKIDKESGCVEQLHEE